MQDAYLCCLRGKAEAILREADTSSSTTASNGMIRRLCYPDYNHTAISGLIGLFQALSKRSEIPFGHFSCNVLATNHLHVKPALMSCFDLCRRSGSWDYSKQPASGSFYLCCPIGPELHCRTFKHGCLIQWAFQPKRAAKDDSGAFNYLSLEACTYLCAFY